MLHIAAGVTGARDMGNDTTTVLALKKKFDEGSLIGPHLLLAGLIDAPGPFQVPTGVLAATEPEVRAAVKRYAELAPLIAVAAAEYAADVRARRFPGPEHCFGMQ